MSVLDRPLEPGRRNSPLVLVVRATDSVTTVVPTLLVWLSVRSRWPVVLGVPVDWIAGVAVVGVAVAWMVSWWTTRFTVDDAGVVFRTGWLVRRSTSLGWSEVASVQVSRSAVGRALGCSRVAIGIGTESKSAVVLDAVPQEWARGVEQMFLEHGRPGAAPVPAPAPTPTPAPADGDLGRAPGSGAAPQGEVPRSGQSAGTLVYRIRVRDYLVLSVTYGQFLLVLPFLYGLYENADALSLLPSTLPSVPPWASSPWTMAAGVVLAVLGALGFGIAVAWLRFRAFEVRLVDGRLSLTGGLTSLESRQVPRSQVVGLKIQQNPLMRVVGYARLSVVSRQRGERIGANVVLPAVSLAALRRGTREHFPFFAEAAERPCRIAPPLAASLVVTDVVVLVAGGAALAGAPAVPAVLTLLLLTAALLVATNWLWVAAEIDPRTSTLTYRRGFIWVTRYALPCTEVYLSESYRLPVAPGRCITVVCLAVYDSRPVRLWIPVGAAVRVEQVLRASPITAAARQV